MFFKEIAKRTTLNICYVIVLYFTVYLSTVSGASEDSNEGKINVSYCAQIAHLAEEMIFASKIHVYSDDIRARSQVEFLNKDFETSIFSNYKHVNHFNKIDDVKGKKIHLGVIEVIFANEMNTDKAYNIIINSNRQNFLLKILTKFILLKKKKRLIVIYSETPHEQLIHHFFTKLKN